MPRLRSVQLATEAETSQPREVWCVDRRDAKYLYHQIFELDAYGGHGVTLSEGDVIVDVGANIGLFLMLLARRLKTMSYYAIEPLPPIYDALQKNAAAMDQEVHCLPFGLSDREAEVMFEYLPRTPCCSTMYPAHEGEDLNRARHFTSQMIHNTVPRWLSGVIHHMPQAAQRFLVDRVRSHYGASRPMKCRTKTLSQVIDEYEIPRIDLLKIDAERAELDILLGIQPEHWPLIRQMILEVHYPSGERFDRLVELLEQNGFRTASDPNPTNEDSCMFYLTRET